MAEVQITIRADARTTRTPQDTEALVSQLMQGSFLRGYLRKQGIELTGLSITVTPVQP